MSPSPKRGVKRDRTPPAKRTQVNEAPEVHPFRPAPLTPIGWDVEAAKAAGTVHPSGREWYADDPDNPNANARRQMKDLKRKGGYRKPWGQPKAKAKAKVQPGNNGKGQRNSKGKGRRGKGKGQAKTGQVNAAPAIKFKPPSKDKGRGKGKKK